MITTKTLPLVLKAATATMPASVVGQRPTIAMVTAINSQKAVLSTDVQNTPVNLQTSSKVTGPGAEAVQIVAKNTVTLVSQQLLLMCAHMRGFMTCSQRVCPFNAPAGFLSFQHPSSIANSIRGCSGKMVLLPSVSFMVEGPLPQRNQTQSMFRLQVSCALHRGRGIISCISRSILCIVLPVILKCFKSRVLSDLWGNSYLNSLSSL